MAEEEVNVISHLLDVEHSASEMISNAQVQADKRIAEARAQADDDYKKQYDEIISGCEREYDAHTQEIARSYAEQIDSYKSDLEHAPKDVPAFRHLLESLLFSA